MGAEPPPQSPNPNDPFREYVERARAYYKRADDVTREYTLRTWAFLRLWTRRAWEHARVATLAAAAWVAATSASLRRRWSARSEQRAERRPDRTATSDRSERPERRRRTRPADRQAPPGASILVARAEDDVASITGRIDTAEDIDVVLVVPRAARRLRQPSAWAHLAAHARRRGMLLRVVSPRRDVRAHARANGLRSASRLRQLQRNGLALRIGDRTLRFPSFRIGGLVKLAIVVSVLAGVVMLVLYRVPSATITVVPEAEAFTTSREVRVSPIVDGSDIEESVVQAESIRETVTTLITTATTGEVEVGEEFATVTLTFSNTTEEDVTVAAGTVVSNEDGTVNFLVDEELAVPAGGVAEVSARAEAAGALYNVDSGALVVADLPEGVTVTNGAAAAGGSDNTVQAVSEEDVARVSTIADQVLEEIAERSLASLLDEGVVFFTDTLSTAVFEAVPLQQVNEPAEVLLVEYTIVVSAFGLAPEVSSEFGAAMIREELPEDMGLLPGTTTTTTMDDLRLEAGQMFVTLEATGMVADTSELELLAGELTGLQQHEAQALIEERIELQGPPDVNISPSLIPWRWLPRSAERIDIVLAGPDFFEEEEDEEDEETEEPEDGEDPTEGEDPLEPLLPTEVPGDPQASPGG